MIIVDGITYDIPIISIDRTADFLDKYAERTESGKLKRELIGVFFNYTIKFGSTTNISAYQAFWDKLTDPVAFHEVTVPDESGDYTFTAYFSGVSDSMWRQKASNYWNGLTVKFTAKDPARIPA